MNEPEQAASICDDVLAADPSNLNAVRTLLLAITEQFHHKHGASFDDASSVVDRMPGEYEKLYYRGIASERWARAKLQQGAYPAMVEDWLHRAMKLYEQAEAVRPTGNDDALLRWNACFRLLERLPGHAHAGDHPVEFGD